MRLKIMIARYCVFVHVYFYSILRLDGIHSVTGAEKFLDGLHSKSQLYEILDVEKTRNGVSVLVTLSYTHTHETENACKYTLLIHRYEIC